MVAAHMLADHMLATLEQDVQENAALERHEHHLTAFITPVRSWRASACHA